MEPEPEPNALVVFDAPNGEGAAPAAAPNAPNGFCWEVDPAGVVAPNVGVLLVFAPKGLDEAEVFVDVELFPPKLNEKAGLFSLVGVALVGVVVCAPVPKRGFGTSAVFVPNENGLGDGFVAAAANGDGFASLAPDEPVLDPAKLKENGLAGCEDVPVGVVTVISGLLAEVLAEGAGAGAGAGAEGAAEKPNENFGALVVVAVFVVADGWAAGVANLNGEDVEVVEGAGAGAAKGFGASVGAGGVGDVTGAAEVAGSFANPKLNFGAVTAENAGVWSDLVEEGLF